MTVVKIQPTLPPAVVEVLQPIAGQLYNSPGARRMAIVEYARVDSNNPDEDVAPDLKRTVFLRLTHLEMASDDKQAEILREVQKALWLHRTAAGTLREDDDVELSANTLEMAAGMLHALEAARLRVAVAHWADHARTAASALAINGKPADALRELRKVADGLERLLAGIEPADGAPSAAGELLRTGSGVYAGGA